MARALGSSRPSCLGRYLLSSRRSGSQSRASLFTQGSHTHTQRSNTTKHNKRSASRSSEPESPRAGIRHRQLNHQQKRPARRCDPFPPARELDSFGRAAARARTGRPTSGPQPGIRLETSLGLARVPAVAWAGRYENLCSIYPICVRAGINKQTSKQTTKRALMFVVCFFASAN